MKKHIFIFFVIFFASNIFAQSISSDYFNVEYNLMQKTWSLYEKKGNSWKSIFTDAGFTITIDSIRYNLNSPEFLPSISKLRSSDETGDGESIKITFSERNNRFRLVSHITVYETLPFLTMNFTLTNTSNDTLTLNKIGFIDFKDDYSGIFSEYRDFSKLLINGFQSWSKSEVIDFNTANGKKSYWTTVFYSKKDNFFKVFGYLTNTISTNTFDFEVKDEFITFRSTADYFKKVLLPDEEVGSDKLVVIGGDDLNNALQNFSKYVYTVTDEINIRDYNFINSNIDMNNIPEGWCSWYYYFANVTQGDILQNLEVAKEEFKDYGLEYIQIDDGYQISAGDWQTNNKFPDGHRWLVNQIHNAGFKAGLWVAPFAVSEISPIYLNYPEWLLEDENGEKIMVWDNPNWGGKIYILDPSHPEAYQWLVDIFSSITNVWNYDYVKIDFLYYATLGKRYYRNVTPIEAYRLGLRAIREGVGSEKFILGCGAPLFPSIGFVDGMRIGTDVSASWNGILQCVNATSTRYFYHQNLWNNDPDCLVIREPLNFVQAASWASFVTLSGGMNLFSDNLAELNREKLNILKKTLPVYEKSFVPIDLFDLRPGITQGITSLYREQTFKIDLPKKWFFKTGDNLDWKDTDVNEMDWDLIDIPSNWENLGFEDYDGYAWYRAHFSIENIERQDLKLFLGKIDDVDEVYLNGRMIGKTGEFPPEYRSEYSNYRVYSLYKDRLNWDGEDNVLAIRVYDGGGPGGYYETTQNFPPEIYNLTYQIGNDDSYLIGIFNWRDEVTRYNFTFSELKIPYWGAYLIYDFWEKNFVGELQDSLNVSLNPNSCKVFSIKRKLDIPQIISTSRHITQGAVDLKNVGWNEEVKILNVESDNLVIGDEYSVIVYIPPDLVFNKCQSNFESEIFQISDNVIEIRFTVINKFFEWSLIFE